jgi:hypothetical protein
MRGAAASLEDVVNVALLRWENEGGAIGASYERVEEPDRREEESPSTDGPACATEGGQNG